MGSAINKLKLKVSFIYTNHKIKKYNEKFKLKKKKTERNTYPLKQGVVKVRYLIKPPNSRKPQYSYTYKGVPGGFF
tara:strand:+ start:453 stop:680 length:228 start_codon:yes stop_codon:yes gene_type:complete